MTAVSETARIGVPKLAAEIASDFFQGGHFSAPEKKQELELYRLNITYKDGSTISMEVKAPNHSKVLDIQRALMTKLIVSSCIYRVHMP